MGPGDKSLFYWNAPDGSKVLTWSTLKGYGWGAHLRLHDDLDDTRIRTIQKELADIERTTDSPVYMNWGSDLYAPNEKLAQNLPALNRGVPNRQFRFATPDDFFSAVSHQQKIPDLSGEIPSSWPNIVASLPHLWQLIVPAENTMIAAEKFAAINYALHYADYPQEEFDFLWKKLIESTDHNHDGQGGWPGDERKKSYSDLAIIRGGEILRDSLRNIAERVQIPIRPSFPIVVFNPLGWSRDDVVKANIAIYGDVVPGQIAEYKKGMQLVGTTGLETFKMYFFPCTPADNPASNSALPQDAVPSCPSAPSEKLVAVSRGLAAPKAAVNLDSPDPTIAISAVTNYQSQDVTENDFQIQHNVRQPAQ